MKKIAILILTAILLGLFLAGSLIAEERDLTVKVHITADPWVPTNIGTVWAQAEGNSYHSQNYHGPDTYEFDMIILYPADFVEAGADVGSYHAYDIVDIVSPVTHIYLHLGPSPKPPPDIPSNN